MLSLGKEPEEVVILFRFPYNSDLSFKEHAWELGELMR